MKTIFLNANWSVSKRTDRNGLVFFSINNEKDGHTCGLFEYWSDLIKELKKDFSKEQISLISKLKTA